MHQLCYEARELTPRNAHTRFISRAGGEVVVGEGEFMPIAHEGVGSRSTDCGEIASHCNSEFECPYKQIVNLSGS